MTEISVNRLADNATRNIIKGDRRDTRYEVKMMDKAHTLRNIMPLEEKLCTFQKYSR